MAKTKTTKDPSYDSTHVLSEVPEVSKPKKDKVAKTKTVEALDIPSLPVSEEAKSMQYIDKLRKLGDEILILSKKIIIPKDDDENNLARDYGKQLRKVFTDTEAARKEYNKPHQEKIDVNNDRCKTEITEPLEKEVTRLKNSISFYETEKERKRLEEEKRRAEEKRKAEEAEAAEKARLITIRTNIQNITTNGIAGLEKCNTLEELNAFEAKVTAYQFKEDFYKEFLSEAQGKMNEIIELIKQRRPLLEEIDKKKKETEALEGEQKLAAQRELEANQAKLDDEKEAAEAKRKSEEIEKENKELNAKQELFQLFSSMGIKKVSDYVTAVVEKYGSCVIASEKRDELIADYQASLIEKSKEDDAVTEKTKNGRTDYLFEITDEKLVPREYLCVDEAKIKKALIENRPILEKGTNEFSIAGVFIYSKRTTVLK